MSPQSARQHVLTRFGAEALEASPLAVPEKKAPALPFRRVEPAAGDRFKTCLPLVELEVAAGAFSEAQTLDHGVLDEASEWVELVRPKKVKALRPGMFVAQVRGRSMEPRIPDGSYCVFQAPVTGSRQNRIVLASHRDFTDPEHGGRYTVKLYRSVKRQEEGGSWRHEAIELRPIHQEFEPMVLESAEDVAVLAAMVEVLL